MYQSQLPITGKVFIFLFVYKPLIQKTMPQFHISPSSQVAYRHFLFVNSSTSTSAVLLELQNLFCDHGLPGHMLLPNLHHRHKVWEK